MTIGSEEASEHASLGTAVHALIEHSMRTSTDAWQHIGQKIEGYTIDHTMANSAQVFLSAVRKAHPDRNQNNCWVERRFAHESPPQQNEPGIAGVGDQVIAA